MLRKLPNKLTQLPIGKRNLIGFFSLIFLLTIISIMSLISITILSQNTKSLYHRSFAINHNSWTIRNGFNTLEKEMYKVIVSTSTSSILQTTADILSATGNLKKLINDNPEYVAKLDLLQESLNTLKAIHQDILEESLQGNQDSALSLLQNDYAQTLSNAHAAALDLTDYAQTSAEDFLSRSIGLKNNAFVFIIVLMLLSILLGIKISLYITKSIINPLNTFKTGLTAFSNGQLNIYIPYQNTDEIGDLGLCLNQSTTILKEYIENISNSLTLLANGHMDITIDTDYKGDFKTIKASILHIAASLNEVLGQIHSATHEVSTNALQVMEGSKALTKKNLHQKELTDDLLNTIQNISHSVNENAASARTIHAMSLEMSSFILEGNKQISTLTSAMASIQNSSISIQKVVDVIDAIASQSHLLALNASIEAAKLGDSGRGFSVIAKEMQELSSRSSAAVNDTTQLIQTCLESSDYGNTTVTQTAAFLSQLVEEINRTHAPITAITYSSTEQAASLNSMLEHISDISAITQETLTFATQTSDIAELLASQSQELKAHLTQFTLIHQ